MSELKSVALWHPDHDSYSTWHTWLTTRGWMVVDVGDSVETVPEVGVWLISWNEQFQRSGLREQFEKRRRQLPNEVWCAVVPRDQQDSVSMSELAFLGIDDVFAEPMNDLDFLSERLDLAVRQVQLPVSRHRVRESIHIRSRTDLAESISVLTGHLMRETDALALTFWLSSTKQGLRAWLRRTQDRIESLGGSLRDPEWQVAPSDQWGIPRRAKAHRWELTSKDEMAWWVPLVHRRLVVGYIELIFASSLSADIEASCLRVREWAPALVDTLQVSRRMLEPHRSPIVAANALIDSSRRAKRPLNVLSLRADNSIEDVVKGLSLRTSDITYTPNNLEAWVVLPETDRLDALLLVSRLSDQLNRVDVGMASLPEDGITFEQLGRAASAHCMTNRHDDGDTGWALLVEGGTEQFQTHLRRMLTTLPSGERGRVVVVSGDRDHVELQPLPSSWSGILVCSERPSSLPERWRRTKLSTRHKGFEVVLIGTSGVYGVRSEQIDSEIEGRYVWRHCAQPEIILRRWSRLNQEFSLGGS